MQLKTRHCQINSNCVCPKFPLKLLKSGTEKSSKILLKDETFWKNILVR